MYANNNPVYFIDPDGMAASPSANDEIEALENEKKQRHFEGVKYRGEHWSDSIRIENGSLSLGNSSETKADVSENANEGESDPPKKDKNALIGGTYNGKNYENLLNAKTWKDYLSLLDINIDKKIISHENFVGAIGVASNLRDEEETASKFFSTTAAFLGVSTTSIAKGTPKFGTGGIIGAYLYYRSGMHNDNLKNINSIKDKYEDIGGYKGVYYIHTTTTQSNYITGGYNVINQLDVYDISSKKHLGGIKNYY